MSPHFIPVFSLLTSCFSMMNCFGIFSSRTKTRQESLQNPSTNQANSTESEEKNLRKFSFSELKKATKNFNISLNIGGDEFGSVYKGSIKPPGGRGEPLVVAIKRLYNPFMLEHEEWIEKLEFFGVVEHPNMVKLLGYCSVLNGERDIERLLVYKYMPKKRLEYHLFSTRLPPPIPWIKRLQILLGVAHGLAYLHGIQVILFDFNLAFVLLDDNFNPKLSDFWIERALVGAPQVVYRKHHYCAPEFMRTGATRSHSDIWSFGVALYEILSGRKNRDINLPQSEQMLIEWVKRYPTDSKMFHVIMDPGLNKQYFHRAARKVAKLAERCLQDNWKDRPTMSEIVDVLQEAIRESEDKIQSPLPESSTRKMVHAAN